MADHAFVHVFALAAIAALLADHHMPQEDKSRAWYLALVCLCPFLALEVAIWSFALYMGIQNTWLTTLETLESFWTVIKTYTATAIRDDTPFLNHSATTSPIDLSDALFVFLIVAVAGAALYVSLLNPAQESDSRVSRNMSAARPHNAAGPSSDAPQKAVAIDAEAVADQTSSPVEGPIRVPRENTSQPPKEAPSADMGSAPHFAPAPTSAQDPRFHTWLRRVDLPSKTRCYASALLSGSDIWLLPVFTRRSRNEPKFKKMAKEQEQRIEDILRMRQQCPGLETDAKIAQKYGPFCWPKSTSSDTTSRKKPNVFKNKTNDDRSGEEPKTSKNKAHNGNRQGNSASDFKDKSSNSRDAAEYGGSVPQPQTPEPAGQRTPAPMSQEVRSPPDEKAEDSAVPQEQHEVPLDDITTDFETASSRPEAQRTEDAEVISASTSHSVENNSDQVTASEGYALPAMRDQSEEKAAVALSQTSPNSSPKEESSTNSKQDTEAISAGIIHSFENNSDHVAASTGYSPPSVEDQVDENAAVAVPVTSSQITPDEGEPKASEPAQTVQEKQVAESEESSGTVDNTASAPTQHVSYADGVESGLRSAASLNGNDESEERSRAVDNVASAPTHNVSYADGVDSGVRSIASSIGNNDNRGAQTSAHPQHQEAPIFAGNHDIQDDIDMSNANAGSELAIDAGEQHQTFTSDDAMDILPPSSNGPDTEGQAGVTLVEHQIGATGGSPAGDAMNIDQEAVEQTMPAAPSLAQNLESHSGEQNASDDMDEDVGMPEVPAQVENQPTYANETNLRPSNLAPAPIFTQSPQSPLFNAPMQMSMNGSSAFAGLVAAQQNAAGLPFSAAQNEPSQGVFAFNGAPQPPPFSFGGTGLPAAPGAGSAFGNVTNSVNSFAPSGAPSFAFSTTSSNNAPAFSLGFTEAAPQQGAVGSGQQSFGGHSTSFPPAQQPAPAEEKKPVAFEATPSLFGSRAQNFDNKTFSATQQSFNFSTERSTGNTNANGEQQPMFSKKFPQNAQLPTSIAVPQATPFQSTAMQSRPVLGANEESKQAATVAPQNDSVAQQPGNPSSAQQVSGSGNQQHVSQLHGTGADGSSTTEIQKLTRTKPQKRARDVDDDAGRAETAPGNGKPPMAADNAQAEFVVRSPFSEVNVPYDDKLALARTSMREWHDDLKEWSKWNVVPAEYLLKLERHTAEVHACRKFFELPDSKASLEPSRKTTADEKITRQQIAFVEACAGYARTLQVRSLGSQASQFAGRMRQDFLQLCTLLDSKRKQWEKDEQLATQRATANNVTHILATTLPIGAFQAPSTSNGAMQPAASTSQMFNSGQPPTAPPAQFKRPGSKNHQNQSTKKYSPKVPLRSDMELYPTGSSNPLESKDSASAIALMRKWLDASQNDVTKLRMNCTDQVVGSMIGPLQWRLKYIQQKFVTDGIFWKSKQIDPSMIEYCRSAVRKILNLWAIAVQAKRNNVLFMQNPAEVQKICCDLLNVHMLTDDDRWIVASISDLFAFVAQHFDPLRDAKKTIADSEGMALADTSDASPTGKRLFEICGQIKNVIDSMSEPSWKFLAAHAYGKRLFDSLNANLVSLVDVLDPILPVQGREAGEPEHLVELWDDCCLLQENLKALHKAEN